MSTNNNASSSQPVNGPDLTTAARSKRLRKNRHISYPRRENIKWQQQIHDDPLSTILIDSDAESESDDQNNITTPSTSPNSIVINNRGRGGSATATARNNKRRSF